MHRKLPERLGLNGVLELVFNKKQIWAATGWRARCQSRQTSFRGRGLSCPSQNRLTSDALLSHWHWQRPRGWADWSPAITDMEYWYILPGSSFHSKEAPFLPSSHVPDPSLVPSQPRPTPLHPGEDKSWAWCSEPAVVKSTRLLSLQLALRRVLLQTSQGFYSTNNCMRGRGEAEKDLCVVVLSPFITLLASSRALPGFLSA